MSAADDSKQDPSWNPLLQLVSQGAVPIVGEELLELGSEPEGTTLYRELAIRYATAHGIGLEAALQGNLSATLRRHPNFFTNRFRIYQQLVAQYEALNPPIPKPLLALAKIRHFNLFVSTTFDDLLVRALDQERHQGEPLTKAISFAPGHAPLDQAVESAVDSGRPVVLQLFGSLKEGPYAVTEADMVEYVHSLEAHQKKRLITELYDRPILLLGNSFPDWLTRILLRLFRNQPLDHGDQKPVYVADVQAATDPRLKFFLENFVTNTEVIEDTSMRFVTKLAERWQDKFGTTAMPPTTGKPRPMPKNAVFISYCRRDRNGNETKDAKAAFAIRDGLKARGVEVWLDKDQLEGGDEYERKIKRYIETASLFLPLVSETTDARESGFFRKEWNWAIQRLPYFTGSQRRFIVPVVLGRTDWRPMKVPPEFQPMHYMRIQAGGPDNPFLDKVHSLYEEVRVST